MFRLSSRQPRPDRPGNFRRQLSSLRRHDSQSQPVWKCAVYTPVRMMFRKPRHRHGRSATRGPVFVVAASLALVAAVGVIVSAFLLPAVLTPQNVPAAHPPASLPSTGPSASNTGRSVPQDPPPAVPIVLTPPSRPAAPVPAPAPAPAPPGNPSPSATPSTSPTSAPGHSATARGKTKRPPSPPKTSGVVSELVGGVSLLARIAP